LFFNVQGSVMAVYWSVRSSFATALEEASEGSAKSLMNTRMPPANNSTGIASHSKKPRCPRDRVLGPDFTYLVVQRPASQDTHGSAFLPLTKSASQFYMLQAFSRDWPTRFTNPPRKLCILTKDTILMVAVTGAGDARGD
jgi:hypothetical protein